MLDESSFADLVGAGRCRRPVEVTFEAMDRARAESTLHCSHELVMGPAYQRFCRLEQPRIRLETDIDVVKPEFDVIRVPPRVPSFGIKHLRTPILKTHRHTT